MQWAKFGPGSSLLIQPIQAYNVATGDFSVTAMMSSRQGGTVVARKG